MQFWSHHTVQWNYTQRPASNPQNCLWRFYSPLLWGLWKYTLNKNINATCKVLVACFMSWNKRYLKCSKFVYIPVSEHVSFSKITHPRDKYDISRNWLNSMIITQTYLVLGTAKGHSKMCDFVTQTQCHKYWGSVQLAFWLQECPPERLPVHLMLIYLP